MPIECADFPSALQAWNTFYKRSLVVTQRGRREPAERQLAKSREAWYQIIWRYRESPPPEYAEDARWQSDLATITGNLHIAEWLVAGGDLEGAHEALEPIRRIWMDVRQRNGIRSFGDVLTTYHDVMEPVVLWGAGQAHGGVTEENIDEFQAAAAKLLEAWQSVRSFPYRPGAPRGRGGGRQFRIYMGRAEEAMEHFAVVVAERRIEEIPDASQGVKSAFLSLFIPFG
jgi:hypothetical protein